MSRARSSTSIPPSSPCSGIGARSCWGANPTSCWPWAAGTCPSELSRRDRGRPHLPARLHRAQARRPAGRDRAARCAHALPGPPARPGDRARPDAAQASRGRARTPRDAVAAGAENGGDRPPDRRHRPRLQQYPDQRDGLHRAGRRPARQPEGRATGQVPRAGAPGLDPCTRPHPADAHIQPQPARRAAAAVTGAAGQGVAQAAALDAACDHRGQDRPGPGSAGGAARPGADRPGAAQPVHQCARRDAGGRHHPRRAEDGAARVDQPCASCRNRVRAERLVELSVATPGWASPPRCWSGSSSRSSAPRKSGRAAAWGWRRCTGSCTSTAGTSWWTLRRARVRRSACCCRCLPAGRMPWRPSGPRSPARALRGPSSAAACWSSRTSRRSASSWPICWRPGA